MVLVACLVPTLAWADAAGTAQGVDPQADAALAGATRTLTVGSDIFIGDLVQTGPAGQVQILFADATELVVGPNSALTIEDYLIRNDGSAGQLAVNMLSGAFRFATGKSAKNRYRIDTPTGTIGVRGTGFDVFVDAITKATWILHYRGSVTFCTGPGNRLCQVLSDACTIGHMDGLVASIMGNSETVKGPERKTLKEHFIYSNNEFPLLSRFRIANAYDCLHNKPDVPPEHYDSGVGGFGKAKVSSSSVPPSSSSSVTPPPTSSSSEPPSSSSEPPSSSSSEEPSSSSSEPPSEESSDDGSSSGSSSECTCV
jgi:hypothetical protein